jgi:hypothetical protein
MAIAPAVTAASHNPRRCPHWSRQLRKSAGGTLNAAPGIIVFTPDNAFAKIPAGTLDEILADKAELTKTLT